MLSDGLYNLTFSNAKRQRATSRPAGEAVAILRAGMILGSDPWGGIFRGTYAQCPATGADAVHVSFEIPPEGTLINGFAAGPDGAQIDIDAAFDDVLENSTTTVFLGGKPLYVRIAFLGPLPESRCARSHIQVIQPI